MSWDQKKHEYSNVHTQVDPKKLGAPSFNSHPRMPRYQKVSLKKIARVRVNRGNTVYRKLLTSNNHLSS